MQSNKRVSSSERANSFQILSENLQEGTIVYATLINLKTDINGNVHRTYVFTIVVNDCIWDITPYIGNLYGGLVRSKKRVTGIKTTGTYEEIVMHLASDFLQDGYALKAICF